MGRFNQDNTDGCYTQVELDELNYRFERALTAEVESWDHESERYLSWKAGLTDENDAEHREWIAWLRASVLMEYEEESITLTDDIEELRQEAGRAGDRSMVLICTYALHGDEEALDVCREALFDARRRADIYFSLHCISVNKNDCNKE